MPKVDLLAVKGFTYGTRRLVAEQPFQARNRDDAMILVELLGKARYGRPIGKVDAPSAALAEKVKAAVAPEDITGLSAPITTRKRKRKTAKK